MMEIDNDNDNNDQILSKTIIKDKDESNMEENKKDDVNSKENEGKDDVSNNKEESDIVIDNSNKEDEKEKIKKMKSKYTGVYNCGKKFKVQIQMCGVQYYLGLFNVEDDAARAYDNHALAVLGSKAKTNFTYPANYIPDVSQAKLEKLQAIHNKNMDTKPNNENISNINENPLSIQQIGTDPNLRRYLYMGKKEHQNLLPPEFDVLPDWREQLYYWYGSMVYDPNSSRTIWRGNWVGSYTGKPSLETLNSSNSCFEMYSDPVDNPNWRDLNGFDIKKGDNNLVPVSGSFEGCYLMESIFCPGCIETYTDINNYMVFVKEIGNKINNMNERDNIIDDNDSKYTVIGKGDSEYGGSFIVMGSYDSQSKCLDIVRQYVSDFDSRSKMSIEELKNFVTSIMS